MSSTLSLKLSADSSDEEMEVDNNLNADSSDDEIVAKDVTVKKVLKDEDIKKVLAADSSDEDIIDQKAPLKSGLAADSSDDEGVVVKNDLDSSDDEAVEAKTIKKKTKALVDSDDSDAGENEGSQVGAASSEEENETEVTSQKKKSKIKRPLDSDSDEENSEEKVKSNLDSSNPLKNRDLYDAESSDEELPDLKPTSQTRQSSDDEKDNNYSDGEDAEESLDDIKKKVLSKHKDSKKESKERKSKSNAMDEIRSESQRMVRESTIGLKYHRPKQRTLEEFLNRKKGTDETINRIFTEKHIRLNKLDSDVDKLLIERQKKMEEFYKSDTDEEDNAEVNKDSAHDLEENCAVVPENNKASDSGILTGVETSDDSNPATDEQKTTPDVPEETTSKPILTENNAIEDTDGKGTETIDGNVSATKDEIDSTEELKKSIVSDPDSLHLVLEPDTLEIADDAIFGNSQVEAKKENVTAPAVSRLALLRSKFDVSQLEESLNFSPKIGSGNSLNFSSNNIFEEEKSEAKLSTGAEKLFKRLVSHSKTTNKHHTGFMSKEVTEKTVDLTIVKKVVNAEGKEVLEKEVIAYNSTTEKKKKSVPVQSYLNMKETLKKKMMEKRNAERKRRAELIKMENEEGFEADEEILDEEEEMDEDADDEEEESEGESEPEEENDVPMVDKKRKSNAYLDEEAEESDEDDVEDDLHLQLDDDEDSLIEPVTKKSQFSKIKDPELLSESSTNSDIFKLDSIRSQVETPTLALTRGGSTAPSSCVSNLSSTSSMAGMAAILQSEPRWTPFQDRVDKEGREITSADNSMADTSPTASQQARKKLGFEGLFDGTDPDVEDVDDVVGLCSGKFVSQVDRPVSPATQATQFQATQSMKLQEMALKNVESQDTVIFESDSRPGSSLSSRDKACSEGTLSVETQDTVILTGNTDVKDNVSSAISRLDKLLDMDQEEHKEEQEERIVMSDDEAARPAPGFMEHHTGFMSSDDEEGGEAKKKKTKKRKRRILSDSEEDGDEESCGVREMTDEESNQEEIDGDVEYDSDENVIPKKETFAGLFSKKGMLKNFVEKEADLSGSEGSEDEDEKGLDILEMEEGDLDDIDEDDVRDQVGRIHNKVILDEDQAEIKLFQERFLEDGEDHDDEKRERQFKWKGMDDNIELEVRKSDDEDETESQRELDEKMRRERVERETWLMQNQEKVQEEVIDKEEKDSQFFKVAEKVMTRMASREEKSTEEKEDGAVFKSPKSKAGPLQPLQLSVNAKVRGSFLARGEKSLKILAEKNKLGGETKTGTGAKASRNFVFARVSPVKQEEPASPTDENKKTKKTQKVKPPPAKRVKLDRTLDPSKKGTVFNLL